MCKCKKVPQKTNTNTYTKKVVLVVDKPVPNGSSNTKPNAWANK
jgi:hypothetical protein